MKPQQPLLLCTTSGWMRLCLSALMSMMLASCGGSSSSTPDTGAAAPDEEVTDNTTETELEAPMHPLLVAAANTLKNDWSVIGPFDDIKSNTVSRYDGAVNDASITVENAGSIIAAAMVGLPAGYSGSVEPSLAWASKHSGKIGDIASFSRSLEQFAFNEYQVTQTYERYCGGGSLRAHVARNVSAVDESAEIGIENFRVDKYVTVMEFENCYPSYGPADGLILFAGERKPDGGYSKLYALADATIDFGDGSLNVTGVLSNSAKCEYDTELQGNLLVTNPDSGMQTLYQDFAWEIQQSDSAPCRDLSDNPWNKVTGTLLLSDIGKIDVSTDKILPFTVAPDTGLTPQPADMQSKLSQRYHEGAAVFTGALKSQLTIQYESPLVARLYESAEKPYVVANILAASASTPTVFQTSARGFRGGIFSDFRDTDGDGLYNSWESYHELDLDDPMDAVKPHLYGSVPATAFAYGVNPLDRSMHVPKTDTGIEVVLETNVNVAENRNELTAVVSGYAQEVESGAATRYFAVYKRFTAKINGNSDWEYSSLPEKCVATDEPKSIDCEYTLNRDRFGNYQFSDYRIPLSVVEDTDISVTVTLDDRAADHDLTNNVDEDTAEIFVTPRVDYQIIADAYGLGDTINRRTITATITQEQLAGASSVTVKATPTSGITVLEAELISTGNQPLVSRCNTDSTVTCTMEDVLTTDKLSLEVLYIFSEFSDQIIDWEVVTGETDLNISNNAFQTTLTAALPVLPLQELIDSAAEDSIVELPAGTYAGTINLQSRGVSLKGASGDEPTILESHSPDEPIFTRGGDYLTISNFVFRTTGGLIVENFDENLTIQDSVFEPVEGKPHSVARLIDSASYRILNSTIRGFGTGEGSTCKSLIDQRTVPQGYGVSIYLERNLIIDNNCDQLIYIDNPYVHHYLNNNTIINNPALINIDTEDYVNPIVLVNNIIEGADSLIKLPASAYLGTHWTSTGLFSSRNAIRDSERAAFLTGTMLSRIGVSIGKTDLTDAPLFADRNNGNYKLSFNSPLIDAGDEPAPYEWTFDNYINEDKVPGDDDIIKAIDGLLDGQIKFDIGAFEYDPNAGL